MGHGRGDRPQQFTHPHYPTIQSRSGQFNAGLPFQNRTLPVERHVIGIFADHRIDHHPITGQAFVDDPGRQRRALNSLFFASFTGTLSRAWSPARSIQPARHRVAQNFS